MELLLISLLSFFGYVGYICWKYGVLKSISDSVYRTNNELLFLLFTLGTALPIIFTTEYVLMQIAGVLLTYVGLSPDFKSDEGIGGKDGIENEMHVIGASGAVAFGMISMVINYSLWFIPIPLIVILAVSKFIKIPNKTFWIEIVAFASIFTGLLIDRI